MMDNRTTEQKIIDLNAAIDKSIAHWKDMKANGCSDPFWPDGVNMNLVRNHVIYYLMQISDLTCQPMQMSMFSDIGITNTADVMSDPRIPPEVDDKYMARERRCAYFE